MRRISMLVLSIALMVSALLIGCSSVLAPGPTPSDSSILAPGPTPSDSSILAPGPTPSDPIQNYIEKVKTILFEEYQLDGEISVKNCSGVISPYNTYPPYCDVTLISEGYANLSDNQKEEVIYVLAGQEPSTQAKFSPRNPDVISQGTRYLIVNGYLSTISAKVTPVIPSTPTPFVMPKGDFEMSWNIYDSTYNTSGGILTISKHGSDYTENVVYPDGSSGNYDLTATTVGGETRLTEDPKDPSGDYMFISSNGDLNFCDTLGLIYRVPTLK